MSGFASMLQEQLTARMLDIIDEDDATAKLVPG